MFHGMLRWCSFGVLLLGQTVLAAEPIKLPLWPEKSPIGDGTYEEAKGQITVHLPDEAKATGQAIVICPGGGYGGLVTGAEGHGIAQWLNQHGIAGIVLEYRLPKGRKFVPLIDAQRAIRTVRFHAAEWKINKKQVGIIGFSAGGHLASTAATHFDYGHVDAADHINRESSRPDFAILVYPVVTMDQSTHSGSRTNLLGANPSAELIKTFSNEQQVTDKTPPMFLAHPVNDHVVPVANSRDLYAALKAHNIDATYVELAGGDHGLNGYKGEYWDEWQTKAISWLSDRKMASAKIQSTLQRFVDQKQIAGAVTMVGQAGKIVHLGSVGETHVDSMFWIASMTKPITGTAVMILQDEGKLSVDDPVSKYIPAFANAKLESGEAPKTELRIRHLLTHTSGLKEYPRKNPETMSLEDQSNALATAGLAFEPGSQWRYGWSLQVAGRIVEIASGKPFDTFVTERILEPLGMKDTTFNPTPEQAQRIAKIYKMNAAKDGLEVTPNQYVSPEARQVPMPSGGLLSCAADLAKFYSMIQNGGEWNGKRIVSAKAVEQMTQVQSGDVKTGFTDGNGWGFTWCVVRQPQGVSAMLSPGTFGHGGAYGTQAWLDPKRKLFMVLLIQRADLGNSDGSDIRRDFQQAAVDEWRR